MSTGAWRWVDARWKADWQGARPQPFARAPGADRGKGQGVLVPPPKKIATETGHDLPGDDQFEVAGPWSWAEAEEFAQMLTTEMGHEDVQPKAEPTVPETKVPEPAEPPKHVILPKAMPVNRANSVNGSRAKAMAKAWAVCCAGKKKRAD